MISISDSEDTSNSMTTGKMISTSISRKESPIKTKTSNRNNFGSIGQKSTRKNLQRQSNLMTMKFLKSIQMKSRRIRKLKTQNFHSSQHPQDLTRVMVISLK